MDGHIWGLAFNHYVCISFCGDRTIYLELEQIQYLTLRIKSPGHGQNQPKNIIADLEVTAINPARI